ncbi:hypothetical protein K474DRAFT_1660535 [Panus rudis PR-1116 ss-1]|nr:hypothetical protein K474DRAFT_1660535 [Panus rudis PR-1116 ss-1]
MSQARINSYHGPKKKLLGNKPGHAAPAWRTNNTAAGKKPDLGSKILLSQLPLDVTAQEVQELLEKTIGPITDVFLIYTAKGTSKGMAIVTFKKAESAASARQKYNNKIIDGRRNIKIEIIKDEDEAPKAPTPQVPSLLARLGVQPPAAPVAPTAPSSKRAAKASKQAAVASILPRIEPQPNPRKALRQKKGPRRLKKAHIQKQPADKDTLDREMEDYRAAAADVSMKSA